MPQIKSTKQLIVCHALERGRRFIDPADQTPRVQWFVILNFRDEKGLGMKGRFWGRFSNPEVDSKY